MQAIEGLTYLLASTPRGEEWVTRYTRAEVDELFTAEEQKAMARGGEVIQEGKLGTIRWIDMVAAARATVG